jgi:hypothetical protein
MWRSWSAQKLGTVLRYDIRVIRECAASAQPSLMPILSRMPRLDESHEFNINEFEKVQSVPAWSTSIGSILAVLGGRH